METGRGHFPLCPFKRGATVAEVPFHHRCKSNCKFLECEGFCTKYPKLARKVFVQLLPANFLPQRSSRPFLVWPPEKAFMCFYANLGRYFYPDFQGFTQIFSKSKILGVRLHPLQPHLQHHCMHITRTAEHVSFHAFYKKRGWQRDLMSCLSCLTLQRP